MERFTSLVTELTFLDLTIRKTEKPIAGFPTKSSVHRSAISLLGLAKESTTLPLRTLSPSKRIVLTGMLQTVSKAKTGDIISITASVERTQKVFMMVQSQSLSLLLQMASTNSTDMSETKTDLYSTTILFSIQPF